jgi:chloride channel 7
VQGVRWGCEADEHNDLATAFWSTPDDLLSRLFSVGHQDEVTGFTQKSLLLYSAIYLSMLALCAGVCVPAGMFMPSVMLGAASGLGAGVQLKQLLPSYHIQPGMLRVASLVMKKIQLTKFFKF